MIQRGSEFGALPIVGRICEGYPRPISARLTLPRSIPAVSRDLLLADGPRRLSAASTLGLAIVVAGLYMSSARARSSLSRF